MTPPTSQSSTFPPRVLLILILTAGQLLPSADAEIRCHMCNYGPKPEEPGAEVMCKKGKPGLDMLGCGNGEDGCYAAHVVDLRGGKRWVRGYGNCFSRLQMECISKWRTSQGVEGPISVNQIIAHSEKKTCFSIRMEDANEDTQFLLDCLHPHDYNKNATIGEHPEYEICPCFGHMCNDGSPRETGKPPVITAAGALPRGGGSLSIIFSVVITGGIAAFTGLFIRTAY